MTIKDLLESKAELTHDRRDSNGPVVLSSRIRLARNLASYPFPARANPAQRREILSTCLTTLKEVTGLKTASIFKNEKLSDLDKKILFERHLISRDLMQSVNGSGILISRDQSVVVMVNEEDHLRLQVLRNSFQFKNLWRNIDRIDTAIEEQLHYAFSPKLGYLTACPTNLGTGMRASVMMHLPALITLKQMDKVLRAVGQLGLAVRGLFGEGSDASGSIFQISNQTTLGEAETEIIKRLSSVLDTIYEYEINAREKLLESEPIKLRDKIGRAYGVLSHAGVLTSAETMNLLSLIRLGVDLGTFPAGTREMVDRLFIEAQPGHVSYLGQKELESEYRDRLRAHLIRDYFKTIPDPDFHSMEPK
ncbi:MAG: protein arginine kinase [Opitutales bacterium]|nr:protein arginine kinase [Opitutales bacterium]